MDTYGDGYAGIGVWRAAFKPLVDRIADTDIRLQWFCCDRSTGVTDASGNRITLIRDTQSPVAVEYQAVKFIGTGRDNIKVGCVQRMGAGRLYLPAFRRSLHDKNGSFGSQGFCRSSD